MPIRFRCRYCKQLLGIARRKAGAMVRCPNCRAEILVPQPETEAKAGPPAAEPIPEAPALLFERGDFEALLQNPAIDKPAPPAAGPSPLAFAEEMSAPPSANPRCRPPGLVLSPTQATGLTVAVILLLALAFAAGLLIGHYLLG